MHNNLEIDKANIEKLDKKIEKLGKHLPVNKHYRGYDARKALERAVNRRAMLKYRLSAKGSVI